jgi:hypothetical protein
VHKRPGHSPRGSVWFTLFDAGEGRPFMHKLTTDELTAPRSGWIAVGGAGEEVRDGDANGERAAAEGASLTGDGAHGRCGAASWSLRFTCEEPELRHLAREWLYRARLPRTKLTSPAPAARFDGPIEVAGAPGRGAEAQGWRGMVGHNWGAEHAERWIWLHGLDFEEAPDAWLDVALGRVKVAGRLTPWVANGALSIDGKRFRVGGLSARGLHVAETPDGCELRLTGERGLELEARVSVPTGTAAGWRYADPDGGAHDVVNCSIAALELNVKLPGEQVPRSLHSAHGAAYELGMREHDHGVPIAPFPDG